MHHAFGIPHIMHVFMLPPLGFMSVVVAFAAFVISVLYRRTLLLGNDFRPHVDLHGGEFTGSSYSSDSLARSLAALIQCPSVSLDSRDSSSSAGDSSSSAFACVHDALFEKFPTAHAVLALTKVAKHSLLYEWKGSDSTLEPLLLVAHVDVVPVSAEQKTMWSHEPFGGEIVDNRVWGRGALDVKDRVVAQLAAVEALVARGVRQPKRTVYLAYGHDEEVMGYRGAGAIAKELKRRGVARLACVVDEGGAVVKGALPGLAKHMEYAAVGTSEKGYLNVRLRSTMAGGHAAWPPAQGSPVTAIGRALAAIHENPLPLRLTPPVVAMLERAVPFVSEPLRTIFANTHVFGPIVTRVFSGKSPKTAAMVRTTIAATKVLGGDKSNVVPAAAEAWLNVRVLPGEKARDAVSAIRDRVAHLGVEVDAIEDDEHHVFDPAPISPYGSDVPAWVALERAFHRTYGRDVIMAPMVMMGGTDSKHYVTMTDTVYRMGPRLTDAEISSVHGADESIGVDTLVDEARLFENFVALYCVD